MSVTATRMPTRTSSAALRSLLRHAQDALAQRDWGSAAAYAARAIDANDRSATAHLTYFLAARHLTSVDELVGVARQIAREVPASVVPLDEALEELAAEGGPAQEDTRALLRAHPEVLAPVGQHLTGLRVARGAFDAVLSDADWQKGLAYGSLELRRAMERAHEDARAVFDEAVCAAAAEVSQACALAQSRVPRVVRVAAETEAACEGALARLDEANGAEDTAITESYSYLSGDIRTARAGLWVGASLVAVALVMLVLALVPARSTTTNALASFMRLSVPVALVVLVAGVILLALRGNLVRANRRGLHARVEAKASVHDKAVSRAERVNGEVASLHARVRALQTMRLDDDSFEDALEELSARVAVLEGAKAEPRKGAPPAPEEVVSDDSLVAGATS